MIWTCAASSGDARGGSGCGSACCAEVAPRESPEPPEPSGLLRPFEPEPLEAVSGCATCTPCVVVAASQAASTTRARKYMLRIEHLRFIRCVLFSTAHA